MLALMNRVPVRSGDSVLVPGGTPHAIGAGILLVEAQEPTDQSILLERTNTTASDDEIFLGLARDVALSAVECTARTDVAALTRHASAHAGVMVDVLPDEAAAFFRMQLLTPGVDVPAGFAVAVVLSGSGALTAAHAEPLDIRGGQTLVVPAAAGDWHITNDLQLLFCTPGTTWPPGTQPIRR
jgi:mannose-6-phosphate isomerase